MRIRYYSATNTGTVDYLRAANLHSLMLELLQQSGRTKAELVCATELSMSTVSDCINRLTRSALLTTSERSTYPLT